MTQNDQSTTDEKREERFAALFKRGTGMLHRGQAERAAELLSRAHELKPEHVDTAVNLSGAYILTKQFGRAVELLEPFGEREPDHVMIWTNLGAAYLGNPVLAQDEEQRQAIDAFKQALEINPVAPNVAYNIGLIYRDRQETEKAIHWFQQAIKANPADQDARNILRRLQEDDVG